MLKNFKLEEYFEHHEFTTRYMLGSSDCESMSLGKLLKLSSDAEDQFKSLWLGYTESWGDPHLRKRIAELHFKATEKDVVVFSGGEEPLYIFIRACLKPEDHVITAWPCYQSYFEIARVHGCSVSKWEQPRSINDPLDIDALKALIRPETKALIINYPHNPTGYLPTSSDFSQVIDFAREHNLLVLSDEVYRHLEQNPDERLPNASDLYENAFSLNVMAKAYGLPGLRIGWVSSQNHALLDKMVKYRHYTTICNSAPSEFLAALGLRHGQTLLARNKGVIERNLALLKDFFTTYPIVEKWEQPKAGPIAYPKLIPELTADWLSEKLRKGPGILMVPSTLFDDGNQNFRLGFGRKNLSTTLEVFATWLDKMGILKG